MAHDAEPTFDNDELKTINGHSPHRGGTWAKAPATQTARIRSLMIPIGKLERRGSHG